MNEYTNIVILDDGRIVITTASPRLVTETHFSGESIEEPFAFMEIGCKVIKIGAEHFEVTLPANTHRYQIVSKFPNWLVFCMDNHVLTIGRPLGGRHRSLRLWTKSRLRGWLDQYPEIDDPNLRAELER